MAIHQYHWASFLTTSVHSNNANARASDRLYRLILHLKMGLILESAIHSVPSLTWTHFNKEPECCSEMTLSCFSVILLQHQTVTA